MEFKQTKSISKKRKGYVKTAHGVIRTPFFMPVGTLGSVKGVSPLELKDIGAKIILANTYHLYLRPGEKIIKKAGGLHRFMRWDKPILSDSGGYQVFSLGRKNQSKDNSHLKTSRMKKTLVKIKEDGVEFTSHLDGSKHLFTPEKVIQIQLDLGVDILMPLDVCPSGVADSDEIQKATKLTIKWAQRSKEYFENSMKSYDKIDRPGLFGIVQGGLDLKLRKKCLKDLTKLDFDGYSVGGLAVDNETRNMWGVVGLMGENLPINKPRYLMGVGTPDDLKTAISYGMDMFDCVLPTRLARHGSVYVLKKNIDFNKKKPSNSLNDGKYKLINLLNSKYRSDLSVIEEGCGCLACRGGFSRAYIAHLIREREMLGMRLATLHNLYVYLNKIY